MTKYLYDIAIKAEIKHSIYFEHYDFKRFFLFHLTIYDLDIKSSKKKT